MRTKQDTIQLIASPCHLETLNTVVRPLLTNGSNVNGWVLVTTMERKGYWNEVLTTSDRVANEGATKTSKGNGGTETNNNATHTVAQAAQEEIPNEEHAKKDSTEHPSKPSKPSTLVESLPVILLTYETIGALKTLLDTGNIIVILDQAENLLNLTRPHKWFKPSSSCYVRMFTTGIRVEDALSLTILAAKMKDSTSDSSILAAKMKDSTSDSSTLQTLRHDYLKAVHPQESFRVTIASTRNTMLFLTKVVLAYAIVNGAQQWVPRWVRSLSSTFASFQSSLSRTRRGGGVRCTRRTQRHRSSWNDSPTMVVLSRKQRRRVTCRSQRKERKERKERPSGQRRPQKRLKRHVTQKPSGGFFPMVPAALVMAIVWAMSNVNKDWTLINAVPKIIDAILTFLFNLLPGIYKGMKQFANKHETRQFTRQVGNQFKRLMGAMQQTAQHTTKSFPAFTRWMKQTFHQFQQVFALDSVMAKVVIVMVGMMVLMWLIEVMRGDGRIGAVKKAVDEVLVKPVSNVNAEATEEAEAEATVEEEATFKMELATYWVQPNDTELSKSSNKTIQSVSVESDCDPESMFVCSRFAKQRSIGAGHMARLKEVRALYDSIRNIDGFVNKIVDSIKFRRHQTLIERHVSNKVYRQQPILLIIPDEMNDQTLEGAEQLKSSNELQVRKHSSTQQQGGVVEENHSTTIFYIKLSTFMNLKFDSQHTYAVQELHFVRPPSPWEYEYIIYKLTLANNINTTRYMQIIGLPQFIGFPLGGSGVAVYYDLPETRIVTPVFQYIRKYTNIFGRGKFQSKQFIKQMKHVFTTWTFPKTPDELLVDLYSEEGQEWDIFQTHIRTKIEYFTLTDISAIQKTFHTKFKEHLTQIQKNLSDANIKSPSPKELLGHYRAERQKYERQLKHEARQKELEKEYQALQGKDDTSFKKQIFNSIFSKIDTQLDIIQKMNPRARSRKRSSKSNK